MDSISLTSLADEKLAEARETHSGRAAHTIHGGHTHELRQTVLALLASRGKQPRGAGRVPGTAARRQSRR